MILHAVCSYVRRIGATRRCFADRFAGAAGLVACACVFGSMSTAAAALAGRAQAAADVETATVSYASADSQVEAHFAVPKGAGRHPAVLLLHDEAGLDRAIQNLTRELAAQGFVVLVPDLTAHVFRARVVRAPFYERIATLNRSVEDVKAGFAYLAQHARVDPARISAVGIGWGGWRTFKLAEQNPKLYRAVVFYGVPPSSPEDDVSKIRSPILGHYARYDFRTTASALAAKRRLGSTFTYHVYEDVDRGFFGQSAFGTTRSAEQAAPSPKAPQPEYVTGTIRSAEQTDDEAVAAAASLAWRRTLEFLRK